MNIKQQKQIKKYLTEEFGTEKGNALFGEQEKIFAAILENTSGKTASQMKTLANTILPCIALYKALADGNFTEEKALEYLRKYMINIVAAKMHSFTAKMELVPGFYSIYSKAFLKIMRTTDLHVSTQNHGRDYYDITITKCLWHTACAENGCAEMCPLFCDADNVTYGGLKKIGFTRTKTLGYGGDCCDFHFFRK